MAEKDRKIRSLPLHVVGLTLAVCGAGILLATLVEAIDGGPDTGALLSCGVGVGIVGTILALGTKMPGDKDIALLDIFLTVTAAWVAMALAGSLPYLVTGALPEIDRALFESVSGFTTTGSTVMRPIEGNSAGILFWRAITQFLGGMGVIVLVVAVLPTVGAGGMSLLAAEAPGPTGERLTPRVRHTARNLWVLYIAFMFLLAFAYMAAGMSIYDGFAHSFTTVSTGGFSPYNASLRHFDSALIEWICIVAMFLAGGSFAIWYRLIRGDTRPLRRSVELRAYVLIVVVVTMLLIVVNDAGTVDTHDRIRDALFVTLAIVSTTGFGTADYGAWSDAAQLLILLLLPFGAMAGSTSGGVKLVRILTLASFAHRETLRQLHPRMMRPVRIGGSVIEDQTANKIVAFMALALGIFGLGTIGIALTGADLLTAVSASATLLGNVGPGLSEVGPSKDFLNLNTAARLIGIVQMMLGRLEIYPILLALVAVRPQRVKSFVIRHRTANSDWTQRSRRTNER